MTWPIPISDTYFHDQALDVINKGFFGPVYNVKGYGSLADGSDDGPGWNAARAAIPAAGGVVLVPAGNWNLATAFTFAAATNITLLLLPGATISGQPLPAPGTQNRIMQWGNPAIIGTALTSLIATGSGLDSSIHRPFSLATYLTATDLAHTTVVSQGIASTVVSGLGPVGAIGTSHAFTASTVVQGSADDLNEYGGYTGFMRADIGAGYPWAVTPGRFWLTDLNLHGPIGVPPNMMVGLSQFINNYNNGSPPDGSYGAVIGTMRANGGGSDATHQAADTFPVDIGLLIIGASGTAAAPNTTNGFTRGIVVGRISAALDGPWNYSSARFDTAIEIRDWVSFGLKVSGRHADAVAAAPGIAIAAGAGPLIVGGIAPVSGGSEVAFEVIGTATNADPLIMFGGIATSTSYRVEIRNSAGRHGLFVCAGVNSFLTGTVAGDGGIKTQSVGKTFHIGGTTRVVSVTTDNKLGLFGAAPVLQQAANPDTSGATLAALETEVNEVKQLLRNYGLMA